MRFSNLFFLCSLLAASVATVQAQQEEADNRFDINLHMLSHGEMRYGGLGDQFTESTPETDHAYFLLGRSRLTMNYRRSGLEAKVTAQHSGIWGQQGQGSFNLYEAWVKMTAKCGLFAQVGRQALSYDDERIIGPDDWAMASMSHDVFRGGYEGHGHKAHVILGFNQNAENTYGGTFYANGSQPYKTMMTLWYHYDVPIFPLGASLLFMNIGMQGGNEGGKGANAPVNRYQQLYGGYLSFNPNRFSLEGSYYCQKGHDEHNAVLNAWMASVKLQYEATHWAKAVAGFDYLSGDDYFAVPKPGMIGTTYHAQLKGFSPVYGSRHKFYGMMDFFYVQTYVNGFSPGLQNLYAGGIFKPTEKLTFSAIYHYLAMATHLNGIDLTLGHDIEIEASYKIMRDVELSVGFSYMDGTETMEKLKRAADKDALKWAWFSLVVNPRVFSTKW